jgi:Fe2+ or Zn2+ uptake regulation protein
MESLETLLTLLHENDLKITPQRRLILELLVDDRSHPTADQVYQQVISQMPNVSRTTVYNTLHELVALGILREVQDLSAGGLRYDTQPAPHHHLFCTRCHRLVDIERDFDKVRLTSEEAAGYQIARYHVTFYGICPACQQAVCQQAACEQAGEDEQGEAPV